MTSIMFGEKTLTDVVKGIRASKRDTALYISQCIAEIKVEINSSDMHVKANALQKLTFLQMMGYGVSWASFTMVEVMSSPRFAHKRIGYLAASQGFTQDTDVILLTTNSLKKELRGASGMGSGMVGVYEAGLAINCISNIVTADLAQDLLPEVTNLTSHPQPYLRKKAILCLYKLFLKYPQGLRLTFGKIQNVLTQDNNPSVVSCAVNVITELSDKNPTNYLPLAPAFFDLLTTSSNNWMLIKVVKLLGSLVPEEPRLARKLLDPLSDIVKNTPAKSLLYEAVHAITLCLPYCKKADGSMPSQVPEIVNLCANTLREFVEEKDQNLKYLGLVGFGSLMVSHPKVLSTANYRPIILLCLSDDDVTIRTRALGLLHGMVNKKNLVDLVSQLITHVTNATGQYKLDLVENIVELCCGEKYSRISNFVWYLDILLQLGHTRGIDVHAQLLKYQLTEVAIRVLPVRAYAVRRSMEIILESTTSDGNDVDENAVPAAVDPTMGIAAGGGGDMYGDNGRGKNIMTEILPGLAWIVGEYSDLIPEAISMTVDNKNNVNDRSAAGRTPTQPTVFIYDDNSEGPYHSIVQAITAPYSKNSLPVPPPSTQKVYIQASMKVFAAATSNKQVSSAELVAMVSTLQMNLSVWAQNVNVEVQERAVTSLGLLETLLDLGGPTSGSGPTVGTLLPDLTTVKDEGDDSSDDDDDNGKKGGGGGAAAAAEANLLGMSDITGLAQHPSTSNSAAKSSWTEKSTTGGTSMASKCRDASLLLNFTLKPSPMKPTGSKAQRKKHQSPPAVLQDTDLLSAPVDLSIFNSLIEQELAQRGNHKLSMEAVSFTQQKPLRVVEHTAIDAVSSGVDFSNMSGGPSSLSAAFGMGGGGGGFSDGGIGGNIGELGGTAAATFQRTNVQDPSAPSTVTPSSRPHTVNDPFYLNSGPAAMMDTDMSAQGGAGVGGGAAKSGFGMIELGDAEESDDEDVKKAKKKKKHRKKSKEAAAVASIPASAATVGMLTPAMGDVTIYDSDDEGEDDEPRRRRGPARKAKPEKEFSGLAKVDLTMPLREDEVMPERKHRVVPDRPFEDTPSSAAPSFPPVEAAASKKDKKKKKKKESKRNKNEGPTPTDSGGVGDLLDLGGFTSTPQSSTVVPATMTPGIMSNQANPINNAFDDLLGLSMPPAPAPSLPSVASGVATANLLSTTSLGGETLQSPSTKSSVKRPWMLANIKTSHATGSPMVDWSKVSLMFRVYRSSQDSNPAASIVVRVDNKMEMSSLNGLKLQLKGYAGGDINVGDVGPDASSGESAKVGPFTYTQPDSSLEMKGTLVTAGCSVSVKFTLPASMHLSPIEGLALEDVARQLSSSEWSSHSAKLESRIGLTATPDKVKALLCNFLRAAEVEPGSSGPANGTFAAQSAHGAQVRVLVKVKTDTLKVDVKCTNPQLGKALVSDMKRLVL